MPDLVVHGEAIRAVSVGGLETCIELPEWKLCFDIGRCPPTAARHARVLFTHAHSDHMGGVVHHCATRDLLRMEPPEYLIPAENEEAFHAMLAAWRKLDRSDLPCTVRPVKPGDRVELGGGRFAEAFKAYHRVPTIGWALGVRKGKLRPDLAGAGRDEIVRRRAAGEEVQVATEEIRVAFCGDTLVEVVDREPLAQAARLLILEVTFLDDRVSVQQARSKGHVHLDEIVERADRLRNEALLFTHVSQRYNNAEMREILDRRLPAALRERVTVLPHASPWAP